MAGGCARCRLGHFVFVNQQNARYQSKSSYLTSWNKKSQELEYFYSIFPLTPPLSFPLILITPPASWLISTSRDLQQIYSSHSKSHLITQTTLYDPSGHPSATYNCIIMLMPRMQIHFQLTVLAPKGNRIGKGKTSSTANMPTSVINQCLWLDCESIEWFISERISGLLQIFNGCGVKDGRVWAHFHDIIVLDPITTCHFGQSQLMWPHCRSRS